MLGSWCFSLAFSTIFKTHGFAAISRARARARMSFSTEHATPRFTQAHWIDVYGPSYAPARFAFLAFGQVIAARAANAEDRTFVRADVSTFAFWAVFNDHVVVALNI